MKDLWTEKYRPVNINDYVFRDENQKKQINAWVKDGAIPHLMFSGEPGVGKTTLAKVLLNELNVNDADIQFINASNETSVEVVRTKIVNFVSTIPFSGNFKYVVLDEFDYASPNFQVALRNLMETYSVSSRFIMTCNYPHKIIPALHSRCQSLTMNKLNENDFTIRVASILGEEAIKFDLETLDSYVRANYPDLRKTLNSVQQNSVDGVLNKASESEHSSRDWLVHAIDLFKKGEYKKARTTIVEQARPEEYDEVFKFFYRNLELWGNTEQQQDQAIVIIRNGMARAPLCADPEINVAATLVELEMNRSS